jgi:hypothetical protein
MQQAVLVLERRTACCRHLREKQEKPSLHPELVGEAFSSAGGNGGSKHGKRFSQEQRLSYAERQTECVSCTCLRER